MTDLVPVNANVLTMDPSRPRATAVAIAHGRITALDEVPPGAARVADLRGAAVLPGFHDAHNHMIGFGMSLGEVDIGSPPDEAVTVEQALRAWTRGSAYPSRQEHVKGSIAPGMLADLVVLSEDPTAVSPDRIAGPEVLATVVDGQFGYGTLD